jgi:cyclophilin family peptidyl-prolyl cis-trans isomerase
MNRQFENRLKAGLRTGIERTTMVCRFLSLFLVLVLICSNYIAAGAEAEDVSAQYAAVCAEWDVVDQKLDDLETEFREATSTRREEIRREYAVMVDKANALLPQLRVAGIAAYEAAPNEDQKLLRLLAGIAGDAVRNDRYEEAMELASLLIDNKCPEKAIYGFAGMAAYCRDEFGLAQQYLTLAKDADVLPDGALVYLTDVAFAKKLWGAEQEIRDAEAQANDLPRVLLKTTKGEILIELYENEAPQTVGNFVSLVEKGYYNGLTFHRVLPGFMAQGGCPTGTGSGGPGYSIYCECHEKNHRKHFRGSLSMAHAGRDTGGSQFFLTFRRTSHLDGQHTVFGRVIEGVEVLAKLQRRDPEARVKPEPDKIVEAKVVRKRGHEYKPTKVK